MEKIAAGTAIFLRRSGLLLGGEGVGVFFVEHRPAGGGELLAELVGEGVVFGGFGGPAPVGKLLDFGGDGCGFFFGFGEVEAEGLDDLVEVGEGGGLSRVDVGEERAERGGGVEVVAEGVEDGGEGGGWLKGGGVFWSGSGGGGLLLVVE